VDAWPKSAQKPLFRCSPSGTGAARIRGCSSIRRRFYYPGKDLVEAVSGNARLSRSRVQCREDEKFGGARSRSRERIEAVLSAIGSEAQLASTPTAGLSGARDHHAKVLPNIRCSVTGGLRSLDSAPGRAPEFYTPGPWRPARISSAIRIATSFAMGGRPDRDGCSSIVRCHMGLCISAHPWRLQATAWSPTDAFRMADIRCPDFAAVSCSRQ